MATAAAIPDRVLIKLGGNTYDIKDFMADHPGGPITFQDDSITTIFGDDGHNMLMLQFGPTIFDLLEIKGSIGYFHGEGSRISAGGSTSSQENYLNLYPVALDATLRLEGTTPDGFVRVQLTPGAHV